jgi:hypothetical protein
MADQGKGRLSHAVTTPEKRLLIEEAFIGLDTLVVPAPRWLGRAHRWRSPGTAAECQSKKTPKTEKKCLI